MSPLIVNKEAKKDQILKAAIKAFAKKGFARTTISDIAQEAGTGKGTIYEYFDSKDDIIHYSFNYFIKELGFDFEEILVLKIPAKQKLKQIFKTFARISDSESQVLIELVFDFWAEGIKGTHTKNILLKEMNAFYASYRKLFSEIFNDGIKDGSFKKIFHPETMATLIIGMIDGLLVQWILDKKNVDFSKSINVMISILLKGISRE